MTVKIMRGRETVVAKQRALINAIRDELEAVPIVLAEGTFQCNERSLTRIRLTVESWGATSLTMTEDGRQQWPDASNQIHLFSEEQFTEFFSRLRTALAARADRLFVVANQYKAELPKPAEHPIFDKNSVLWQEHL